MSFPVSEQRMFCTVLAELRHRYRGAAMMASVHLRRTRPHRDDDTAVMPDARAAVSDDARVGETVGGYRLVRLLATGRRASVYLGHAGAEREPPGERAVAVKVFHRGTGAGSVDSELEALARSTHEHALRLLDVATCSDGFPCLVVERLGGGGLSGLVAKRESISPGEAVTILAPLVSALDALHASGVAHGGVRLSSVLFRSSGAPVLAGFGAAQPMPPAQSEAALAGDPRVAADRAALLLLERTVLSLVPGEAAAALVGSADAGEPIDEARLFALAEPEPVLLDGPPTRTGQTGSAARLIATPAALSTSGRRDRTRLRSPDGRGVVADALGRLGRSARDVRPRVWLLAGAVAVSALVAAVALPPTQPTESAGSTGASPAAGPDSVESTPAPDDAAAPADDAVPTDGPVTGDDPVPALSALLAERDRCIRDLSVLCLDAVLQAGSVALERDTALIRSIQNGGEIGDDATIRAESPALAERLGDSALVVLDDRVGIEGAGNGKPASTLMMRGEAGWRIRDYLP